MDRLTLLLLEMVKVNKHSHLLNSVVHLKAAGNTGKERGKKVQAAGDMKMLSKEQEDNIHIVKAFTNKYAINTPCVF